VITKNEELPKRYLDLISREIETLRGCLPPEAQASQIHFGGGTPTHLEPDQLDTLMATLTRAFPTAEAAELSIEVDPRVTTDAHVEMLQGWGFDRISLGVQDFDPRVQRAIHRIQTPETVRALTESARRANFSSVNFDLIYGLPFQTVASFDRTLDQVFSLGPDRVALYSYAHVSWLAKQQRGFERIDLPSSDLKLQIMLHAIRRFLAEGYVHIGMDHFAKRDEVLARAAANGQLQRNFMGYTTKVLGDLIGLGPSAISECAGDYAQSFRDLPAWEDAVRKNGLATFRGHSLSEEDRRRSWVIRQIMCAGRVSGEAYRNEFGRAFGDDFSTELRSLAEVERDGLVVVEAGGDFRVTATGSLLLRNLAMIFDAYLPGQREREQPMFSKTV
jgi:oxygen-independent coproporphyrinogen-3 oxidase